MLQIIKNGNIFESGCQTLVNPINVYGAMGAGLAKDFKKYYPEMYRHYVKGCELGKVKVGKPYIYIPGYNMVNGYYHLNMTKILNFPTKDHWKDDSKIEWITEGLQRLVKTYKKSKITSLAIPALGCGLGNLDSDEVFKEMKFYLEQLEIPVKLYWNFDIPEEK